MNRVVTGSDYAIRLPLITDPTTGELADADTDPTVTVERADGTSLAAPTVSNIAGAVGAYSALLLADTHLDAVDRLTVAMTATVGSHDVVLTDYVDVAGAAYLTNGELRQPHGLDDATAFPLWMLRDLCSAFEVQCERWCGRALVPRYIIETRSGSGCTSMAVGRRPVREVVSAAYDYLGSTTTLDVTGWFGTASGLVVTNADVFPSRSKVTVHYRAGEDAPPESVKYAAGLWIRDQAMKDRSQTGRSAISTTDPYGVTQRLSTPDWGSGARPTGLFTVDEALNGLGRDVAIA